MELSLKIIESFNLEKKAVKPDWDDAGFEFTLPSGIVLIGFHMLNSEPCETNSLEGVSGYIYIQTKEELEELISLDYDQIFKKIKEENPDCDIEKLKSEF